jgi:prepilin-type N-terminal cleavage/methylation domain-containing protein
MDMLNSNSTRRADRGFTLIEVLVGIVIFALGMMALAQLQGSLAKNSADANARTVANNIAEEVIEAARTFGTIAAFNDIDDETIILERGGINYTVARDVTDYYYTGGTPPFSIDVPPNAGAADFKLLELSVTWNTDQRLQIDGSASTTTGAMGSGSIELTDIISSITSPSGGKVSLSNPGSTLYAPPVDYNPGANPDIISIQLGQNKFKESTTPLPDVIRADELVETRFDVVTYSQDDAGATFLRREEFRAVSCECTLRAADSEGEGGLRPTVWDGNEYTQAEYVAKPWGEPANNQQSDFCEICCRDHHDGGTGTEDQAGDPGRARFNPFRLGADYHTGGTFSGDHKHYNRDNNGNLEIADSDGDTYVEACRMVRKDGFFRIAQDLRQEGLNAFPASYLDQESEVDQYSGYVTDVVLEYEDNLAYDNYEQSPPLLTEAAAMSSPMIFPASTYGTASRMRATGTTEQQLRSRGIYIDYMSDGLRSLINCLESSNGDGSACGAPHVTTTLEVIPFYDVQLTWLSRWNETPNNNPIDVTNEAIKDSNAHSRGIASLEAGFGYSTVNAAVHSGNLGLTGTDPIDTRYSDDLENKNLYVLADAGNTPPPLSGVTVAGNITSSVGGLKAADVEISASNAQCDRTNLGFECVIESGASNPRLTVSNYFKRGKVLLACSDVLTINGTDHSGDTPASNWTRFNLPSTGTLIAHIVIREDSC